MVSVLALDRGFEVRGIIMTERKRHEHCSLFYLVNVISRNGLKQVV
jgi:hypothetical protein